MNIDMAMFQQAFFEEAADLLADLEGLLLRLEETPEDVELLNTIFRCAHSIKGGSATFGFADLAHFTHGVETLLDEVRTGRVSVTPALSQVLFESLDQMKALVSVLRGEREAAPDSQALQKRIQAAATNGAVSAAAPKSEIEEDCIARGDGWGVWSIVRRFYLHFFPGPELVRNGCDPILLLAKLAEKTEFISVECDTSRLPELDSISPEVCYLGWDIVLRTSLNEAEILDLFEFVMDESEVVLNVITEANTPQNIAKPREQVPPAVKPREDLPHEHVPAAAVMPEEVPPAAAVEPKSASRQPGPPPESHTLRVATEKVDKLINLVGEMVINQSILTAVIDHFDMEKLPRLVESVSDMQRSLRELQERIMGVRMLPIKHAFGRFPRVVRDLAAAVGKKVELKTFGDETELDKSVIEAIADPLTHLIRNSVDHGLETPDERVAAGKPETGCVCLRALQEGGSIVVEVSDDGRGLSRERILKKAIERGLLSANDTVPDDIIYNQIFQPGFSTAASITDISGRGVGMDIVRQTVHGLGGNISLTSEPGEGSCFRIRLPLTMAILDGMSIDVGGEVYILPLTSIVESIRPKRGDVRVIAGRGEVVQVRNEVLRIVRLYEILGITPNVTEPTEGLLVLVENEGRKVALLVDELIGQNQVVIKSVEANYRKVNGIAGATILGDGRVALILDVPEVFQLFQIRKTDYAAAA